jgi:hypothetical protein
LTPSGLLARLVDAYGVESEDALAGRTPNSLRTLRRWKKNGFPDNVRATLTMLSEAGLLLPLEVKEGAEAARMGAALATIAQSQQATLAAIDEIRAQLAGAEAVRPGSRVRPRSSGRKS